MQQTGETASPKVTFLSLPNEVVIIILGILEDKYLALSEHQRRRVWQTPANALSRVNRRLHAAIGPRIFRSICAKTRKRMGGLYWFLVCQPEYASHVRSLTVSIFDTRHTIFTPTLLSSITELKIHAMSPSHHRSLLCMVAHSCNLNSLTIPWDTARDIPLDREPWWGEVQHAFPKLRYLKIYPMAEGFWSKCLSLLLYTVKDTLEHLSVNTVDLYIKTHRAQVFFESIHFPRLQVISVATNILPCRPAFQFISRHPTLVEINMAVLPDTGISWESILTLMIGTWTERSDPEIINVEAALEDGGYDTPITRSFAFARRIVLVSHDGSDGNLGLDNIIELAVTFVPRSLLSSNHTTLDHLLMNFPSLEVLSISTHYESFWMTLSSFLKPLRFLQNIRHITIAISETTVGSSFEDWSAYPPFFSGGAYDVVSDAIVEDLAGQCPDPLCTDGCDLSFHGPQAWANNFDQTVAQIVMELAKSHSKLETFTWYPLYEGISEGDRLPAWIWTISRRWNGLSSLSADGRFVWQGKGEHLSQCRVAVGREHLAWSLV